MSLYWLLAAIVIITYCVYYGVSLYTSSVTVNRIGSEEMSLSKITSLGSNVDLNSGWTNSSGSTLIFFILPTIKDRTSVVGNEYATALNIGSKQDFDCARRRPFADVSPCDVRSLRKWIVRP